MSSLASPNTTFSSRENARRRPLVFPHGESIFINFIALENLFCLVRKKKKREILNGPGKSGGRQVSPPRGPPDVFSQQQVTGRTPEGCSSVEAQRLGPGSSQL